MSNIQAIYEWLITQPEWKADLFAFCYPLPIIGRYIAVVLGYKAK